MSAEDVGDVQVKKLERFNYFGQKSHTLSGTDGCRDEVPCNDAQYPQPTITTGYLGSGVFEELPTSGIFNESINSSIT